MNAQKLSFCPGILQKLSTDKKSGLPLAYLNPHFLLQFWLDPHIQGNVVAACIIGRIVSVRSLKLLGLYFHQTIFNAKM
jgi:hypothetical protein